MRLLHSTPTTRQSAPPKAVFTNPHEQRVTATPQRAQRAGRRRPRRPAALALPAPVQEAVSTFVDSPLALPAAATGSLALLLLAAKAALHYRLTFITAALLTNRVPKGARVLQLGGSIRWLYYYPNTTKSVRAQAPGVKPGLWGQAGVQAAVLAKGVAAPVTQLQNLAGSSVEAVVAGGGALADVEGLSAAQQAGFLQELLRVLAPGRPFIFCQRGEGEGLGGFLQLLLGNASGRLRGPFLEQLQASAFTGLDYNIVLQSFDPHIVGEVRKPRQEEGKPQQGSQPKSSKQKRRRKG